MKTVKSITIILYFLLAYANINAQAWQTNGTTWYYTNAVISGYVHQPNVLTITGDTMINNIAAKIITGKCNCAEGDNINYVYEDSNRVYRYYEELSDFRLLYDFNKKANESYIIYGNELFPQVEVLVDSIGSITSGDTTLVIQYIDTGYEVDFGDFNIVGVGSNHCLFQQGNICDPQTFGIRCFGDNQDNYLNFQPDIGCTDTLNILSTQQLDLSSITVYPNPATDVISINNPTSINYDQISLFDNLGQRKTTIQSVNAVNIDLDITALPKGIYYLRFTQYQVSGVLKILKISDSN